jgi:hypothetical protein
MTPITVKQITYEVEVALQGSGPPLRQKQPLHLDFQQYLLSLGGNWMWDHVLDQQSNVEWIRDALTRGTAVI